MGQCEKEKKRNKDGRKKLVQVCGSTGKSRRIILFGFLRLFFIHWWLLIGLQQSWFFEKSRGWRMNHFYAWWSKADCVSAQTIFFFRISIGWRCFPLVLCFDLHDCTIALWMAYSLHLLFKNRFSIENGIFFVTANGCDWIELERFKNRHRFSQEGSIS